MADYNFTLMASANKARTKLNTEARGRLEYYRSAYKHAIETFDEIGAATAVGQIKGYTDALAGFKIISDAERALLTLYYMDAIKEDSDNV